MGNKSSSGGGGGKAHHNSNKRLASNNPRSGIETKAHPPPAIVQQTKQEQPPMLLLTTDSSSSTTTRKAATDETGCASFGIEKSATVETLYRDISEAEEGQQDLFSSRSTSYQDVAHHHLFTCDEQLVLAANHQHSNNDDDSGSINAPDLPLDAESCSLKDIVLCVGNDGLDFLPSKPSETSSDCFLAKDVSSAAEPAHHQSRSVHHQLGINFPSSTYGFICCHTQIVLFTLFFFSLFGSEQQQKPLDDNCKEKLPSPCPPSWSFESNLLGQLDFLNLEIPSSNKIQLVVSSAGSSAKHHLFKLYSNRLIKAVGFSSLTVSSRHLNKCELLFPHQLSSTCVEINMPADMMMHHNSPSSSPSQNNNGPRPSPQPFTLTKHKKVEIPTTNHLNSAQHAIRREPPDLGIPYHPSPSKRGVSVIIFILVPTLLCHFSRVVFIICYLCTVRAGESKQSNVLSKVASLTYELSMEPKQTGSPRTRLPPERQDLGSLDNFEGTKTLFLFFP